MVRCRICEIEVGDDRPVCPLGHALGDGPGGVVVPAGGGADGVVRPAAETAEGRIKLVTLERSAEGLLGEVMGSFAPDAHGTDADPQVAVPAAPTEAVFDEAAVPVQGAPEPAVPVQGAPQPEDPAMAAPDVSPTPIETSFDLGPSPADVAEAAPAVGVDAGTPALLDRDLIGKPVRAPRATSRKPLLVVPIILAVLAGAGGFVLLGGGRADAATYRRAFTPKETHRYSFEMTMNGSVDAGPISEPMRMRMSMTLTERTLAVDASGVATIQQRIDTIQLEANGERVSLPGMDDITITVRMAPDGSIVSVEGMESLGFGQPGTGTDFLSPNTFSPLLPADAVAPGDTWTVTEEMPTPFGGAMTLTARNRLVQRGVEGGVETALIRSELDMPMDFTIGADELLAAAGGAGIPGLPDDAEIVYDGGMQMEMLQSIEVATGRPLTVSGNGTADIGMRFGGIRGMPEMRMRFSLSVTMSELQETRGAAASA